MKILVLDDMEPRHIKFRSKFIGHTVDSVYTFDQFKEAFPKKEYNVIFLDADLADEHYEALTHEHEDNGVAAVRWLLTQDQNKDSHYIIHSLNPAACDIMYHDLLSRNYKVDKVGFLHLDRIQL